MINGFSVFVREEITEWCFHPVVFAIGMLCLIAVMIYTAVKHDVFFATVNGFIAGIVVLMGTLCAGEVFPEKTGEYRYKDISDEIKITELQDSYNLIEQNWAVFIVEEREVE